MADGIAPAVDKVGAPEPTAPEALAGAPTLETAKPETSENPPAQAETAKEPPIIAETKAPEGAKPAEPFNIVDAFKLAHQIPRPVEVQSVPETPVNRSVNGSPKPELNIPMEPEEPPKPQEEPVIITRIQEPLPTPTASIPNSDIGPDSIVDKPVTPNGESKTAEMAGALQTGNDDDKSDISEIIIGKRKLAEIPADVPAASSAAAEKEDSDESEPADKKAKIDEGDASTNGGAPRKPGRPKKSNSQKKTAPPVVGKTARKTRSQGPVEV